MSAKAAKSWLFALVLLCSSTTFAAEPAPSEASLRDLLALTRAQDTLDTMLAQMDAAMETSMRQAMEGQALSDAQRKLVDEMRGEMIALLKAEMAWNKMEPGMLEVYRTSFTQSEVDGMLAFYRSDAGKAVVAKMPLVLQNSMKLAQERLGAVMPQVQALQQEYLAKIEAAK
jgi:hypothetical protein